MNLGPRKWMFGGSEKMPEWILRRWFKLGDCLMVTLVGGAAVVVRKGDTIHATYHGKIRIERAAGSRETQFTDQQVSYGRCQR